MMFLGKLLLNHMLKGDSSGSIDFKHIEKKLFGVILLISFLIALMIVFFNSLISLANLHLLGLGFSEKELALINVVIIGSLISGSAVVVAAYLKGFFPKKKTTLSLDTVPNVVTNCISEFIKGYKGLKN